MKNFCIFTSSKYCEYSKCEMMDVGDFNCLKFNKIERV